MCRDAKYCFVGSFTGLFVLVMLLAVGGCSDDPSSAVAGEACEQDGEVQGEYVCRDGTWVVDDNGGEADAGIDAGDDADADSGDEDASEGGKECDCEIDGTCVDAGDPHPDQPCSICDPDQSEDSFVDADDGTACDDVDDACAEPDGVCDSGECVSQPICEGTDTDCGCDSCVDCTEMDEWVDVGDSYRCCNFDELCYCQEQVLHEYQCEGTSCSYEETEDRTVYQDCQLCEDGTCEDAACVCVPDCDGAECGDDGCGGSCGTCADGEHCSNGECMPDGQTCVDDADCGPFAQCCNGDCMSNTVVCP